MRLIELSQIPLSGNMFDGFLETQTEEADAIEKTFSVAGMNCVAILNNYGVEASLTIQETTQTIDLIRDSIKDWWDWFFAPSRIGRDTVFYFPDQPEGAEAALTISYPGGIAKCGIAVTGVAREIGTTRYDIKIGISDYSKVLTDDFGRTYFNPGKWAKRCEAGLYIPQDLADLSYRAVVNARATAVIFDYNNYPYGPDDYYTSISGLQSLIVYGYTEDFKKSIHGPLSRTGRHEAQGLI